MACAFSEDFSDLALFAASPTALWWALLVLAQQEERQRDQERWAGRARRPQHDIRMQLPVAIGGEQLELFACATLCLQMRMRHPYDFVNSIPDVSPLWTGDREAVKGRAPPPIVSGRPPER
jgi:hypothetical protein